MNKKHAAKPRQAILKISSTIDDASSTPPLLVYGYFEPLKGSASLIVAQPNLPVSLKCHLPAPGRLSTATSRQVMWYLDGAYIHSSGAQDVFNLSLADLGRLKGLKGPHLGGQLSCAHHVLAPSSSPENFHGSSMKVYRSANQFDFRLQGKLARCLLGGRHKSCWKQAASTTCGDKRLTHALAGAHPPSVSTK